MPKGKGASGVKPRTLAGASLDVDSKMQEATPAPASEQEKAERKQAPRKTSQAVDGLRGAARAAEGDPIEKVTITLPRSTVMTLDEIVFERKRTTRAYNRSALIQEALTAFLESAEQDA